MTPDDSAARIKQIRASLGNPSQKDAGIAIGVSEATWQRMEAGDGLPKGETLIGLAKLGFSPTWVLTGQGPMRLGEAAAEPAGAPASPLLFGAVDVGRLDEAFRDALARCGIRPDDLGDTNSLILLTILLHDAGVKATQTGKSQISHAPKEKIDGG